MLEYFPSNRFSNTFVRYSYHVRLVSTHLFVREKMRSRIVSALHYMIARAEGGGRDMRILSIAFIQYTYICNHRNPNINPRLLAVLFSPSSSK